MRIDRSLVSWGAALILVAAAIGVVVRVWGRPSLGIDEAVLALLRPLRESWPLDVALFLNGAGGGWIAVVVIPLVGAGAFLLAGRRWSALAFVLALAASALVNLVLKLTVSRARPLDAVLSPDSFAYPSGHTANAAAMTLILALLLRRSWVWLLGLAWTIAMLTSRLLLGVHWLTDTLGGLLVGIGAALIVWGVLRARIADARPVTASGPSGTAGDDDDAAPAEAERGA